MKKEKRRTTKETTTESKEKKPSTVKRIAKIIGNVLFYLVVGFLIILGVIATISKAKGNYNGLSIFGYSFYIVGSNSMAYVNAEHAEFLEGHDDRLEYDEKTGIGTLVVVKEIPKDYDLQIYDVVTFVSGKNVIIHRIVDQKMMSDGMNYYTRGDSNTVGDAWRPKDDFSGILVKNLGLGPAQVVKFIQSGYGIAAVSGTLAIILGVILAFYIIDEKKKKEEAEAQTIAEETPDVTAETLEETTSDETAENTSEETPIDNKEETPTDTTAEDATADSTEDSADSTDSNLDGDERIGDANIDEITDETKSDEKVENLDEPTAETDSTNDGSTEIDEKTNLETSTDEGVSEDENGSTLETTDAPNKNENDEKILEEIQQETDIIDADNDDVDCDVINPDSKKELDSTKNAEDVDKNGSIELGTETNLTGSSADKKAKRDLPDDFLEEIVMPLEEIEEE